MLLQNKKDLGVQDPRWLWIGVAEPNVIVSCDGLLEDIAALQHILVAVPCGMPTDGAQTRVAKLISLITR